MNRPLASEPSPCFLSAYKNYFSKGIKNEVSAMLLFNQDQSKSLDAYYRQLQSGVLIPIARIWSPPQIYMDQFACFDDYVEARKYLGPPTVNEVATFIVNELYQQSIAALSQLYLDICAGVKGVFS